MSDIFEIVAGIGAIIFVFKMYRMTDDVKKIKEILEQSKGVDTNTVEEDTINK